MSTPSSDSGPARLRVVIGGGGVAALEAALALRELAGECVELTLVSPRRDFVVTPLAVGAPFGLGRAPRWPLSQIAHELRARQVAAVIDHVDAHGHRVRLSDGAELPYDVLLLAVGARRYAPFPHVATFDAEADPTALGGLVADLEEGWSKSVAFVVPPGVGWTLPAYELALLTARQVSSMGIDGARIAVVTPEERPLAVFGPLASAAACRLLERGRVTVRCGAYVESVTAGRALTLAPGNRRLPIERVVALPLLAGPLLGGVPHDPDGFLPIDEHARVLGVEDVFAAGDGTDFPIKQGGIAAQQADAAAEVIARRAGVGLTPEPFRPRLRAWLSSGSEQLFFEAPIAGGSGAGVSSQRPLWSPPTKIAGRYLGPWLSAHARPHRPRRTRFAAGGGTAAVRPIAVPAGSGRR